MPHLLTRPTEAGYTDELAPVPFDPEVPAAVMIPVPRYPLMVATRNPIPVPRHPHILITVPPMMPLDPHPLRPRPRTRRRRLDHLDRRRRPDANPNVHLRRRP